MKVPVNISAPRTDYYPLKGGLDLVTPAIAIAPGKCFDAQNYVPEITGGYRRLYGYERFDGRIAPTSAGYWLIKAVITGSIAAGATITGATSAASGRVLKVLPAGLVIGRVTGVFVNGEALKIGAPTVATSMSGAALNGASQPADDADFALLAANDRRVDILAVPGSGQIRGLIVLNDLLYAFRDNAGATAGAIWKQSPAGWVAVPLGSEIQFTGAVGQIFPGDLITGGTSGATAVVTAALLRSGTWVASGAGTLIVSAPIGTFVNGEALKVSTVTKATSASAVTAVARLPGGRIDSDQATFNGSTAKKAYGADGVNLAFEFDGSAYVPIRTGNAVDAPAHVKVHKNHLMLSFGSSMQYSGIGNPYSWTALTGAAELAAGAPITGFQQQSGNAQGASLAAFTKERTLVLYGSSSLDFNLVPSNFELGFSAFSYQAVGNDVYGMTARGIQALKTTQEYGDFLFSAVSFPIQPLIQGMRGREIASVTSQTYSQYRIYFDNGTAIVVGLTGGKVSGLMPLNYGRTVRCITAATLSTGEERTYFGGDDGMVYQDNVGTSFDGAPIEAWIRLAFNNLSSPQVRKRFLRAVLDVKTEGFAEANVSYDLGYANPDVRQSPSQPLMVPGVGGYWGQATWSQFVWNAPLVSTAKLSLDGTENNLAFLFYSKSARDRALTVQGVNLQFIPRRIARGS